MRKLRKSGRVALRCAIEGLEDRRLLTVSWVPGVLGPPPTDRTDIPTGMQSGTTEPIVTINPRDPGVIALSNQANLITSQNAGGTLSAAVGYGSFLTGAQIPTQPPSNVTSSGGDTDTAFDANGRLFWTNLARTPVTPFQPPRGVAVVQVDPANPSSQIGSTALLPNNGQNDDKQFMAADTDPLGISPYRNNLYMAWTRLAGNASGQWEALFSRSTDNGATWSTPVQISAANGPNGTNGDNDDEGQIWPADVAVAANGDVYVAYHAQPGFGPNSPSDGRGNPDGVSGMTFVARSTDGGQNFTQKTVAFTAGQSDITANVQTATGSVPNARFWMQGAFQPIVLADPAQPGNVYVIANDDPDNNPGSGDDGDVVISRSTDYGLTWSVSTISAGPSNSLQVFPMAAIDRFGTLVVAWYDTRAGVTNAQGDLLLDVRATYSVNGGVSWVPSFQINDTPLTPVTAGTAVRLWGVDADGDGNNEIDGDETYRIGEYFGVDVFGGTAYVLWNGNTFSGSTPTGHQAVLDAFAIRGSVTVSGDDNGVTHDNFILRRMAGNTDYVEVLVNGQRQYAGLLEGLFNITIDGKGGNDRLMIDYANGDPTDLLGDFNFIGGSGTDLIQVTRNADMRLEDGGWIGAEPAQLIIFGQSTINLNRVEQAWLTGGPSANDIDASGFTGGPVYLVGLGGDDSLQGGSRNDIIEGGDGNDTVRGNGGNDTVVGGRYVDPSAASYSADGDDSVYGGSGNDLLIGDHGVNTPEALAFETAGGVDYLSGGTGNDTIHGQGGIDAIEGGYGSDSILGGIGNDIILGGNPLPAGSTAWDTSPDFIDGGKGDDLVYGDSAQIFSPVISDLIFMGGADTILGGEGDDSLHGQAGNDLMVGGLGVDELYGGHGNDRMMGGATPTFPQLTVDNSGDLLQGGSGNDTILGDNGSLVPLSVDDGFAGGSDTIDGGYGNDVIYGQAGADEIDGGPGNDLVHGGRGGDTISGGTGNDTLKGELGDDSIRGGAGNDSLEGGDGDDTLEGEEGNDWLLGGEGNDVLLGGPGNDWTWGLGGQDLAIGGTGNDNQDGGTGDDILIGGTTSFDNDPRAISAIMAEWTSGRDLLVRRQNLTDGSGSRDRANGDFFLVNEKTVLDDTGINFNRGETGDWAFATRLDRVLRVRPRPIRGVGVIRR